MADQIVIRAATTQDLPALLELYDHLTAEESPPSNIHAANIFQNFELYNGSQILIGLLEGNIVSSCTLVVVPNLTRAGTPYALIENVVTHCDFRQRGFGRAILDAAVAAAWQAKCYKVMLLTGSISNEIMRFYQGAGFSQSKTGFQIRQIAAR